MQPKPYEKREKTLNIHGIVINYFQLCYSQITLPARNWKLLHSHRLGQVPWEVDVQVSKDSEPVGNELKRNDV